MLVHSALYYRLDSPLVTDAQFDLWARELAQLQAIHDAPIGFYDGEFADWQGTAQAHGLPQDGWIFDKADALRVYHHLRSIESESESNTPPNRITPELTFADLL